MDKYILDMHLTSSNLFAYISFWDRDIQDYRIGQLLFDTGASVTTVSKNALSDLGYDVDSGKAQKIITASGVAFVNEVPIDKIQLGGCVLENVKVYAHSFPEDSFTSGVIGLNIIAQFDVNMLFGKKIIELSRLDTC